MFEDRLSELTALVKPTMSPERFEHSKRVAQECVLLAERFDAPRESAWIAGMVHDICREMDYATTYQLAEKSLKKDILGHFAKQYFETELSPVLYHGLAATSYMHQRYPLSSEIYLAIASHTLGCAQPTQLQKILYIADTMEPWRGLWTEDERRFMLAHYSLNRLVLEVIVALERVYGKIHDITLSMKKYIEQEEEQI